MEVFSDFYEGQITSQPKIYEVDSKQMHDLLLSIGVPPNIYGYTHILTALQLIMTDPGYLHSVTKGLYIDVASANRTTPSSVERSIRHAISMAWKNGNPKFKNLFKYSMKIDVKAPSNSVFLARLYFHLINN